MFQESPTLADVLHRAALGCFLDNEPAAPVVKLLALARDLGHLDPEIAEYLQKQLNRIDGGGPDS
jgi:hypothetical protein